MHKLLCMISDSIVGALRTDDPAKIPMMRNVLGQDKGFPKKTNMTTNSDMLSGWFKQTPKRMDDEEETSQPSTGATTGGGSDQEPVVVWEAANRMEAQIVKGRLESEGIPAIIRGEALGAIYGLTTGGLAATTVLVPAPLAEKALEILSTEVEWEEPADDDAAL
jgi:hypothetical protein